MKLKLLAKDGDSGPTGCPSVYLDEDGLFTVQGDLVDDDTVGNLENLLPGEGAVRIRPGVLLEAVRCYEARR